MSKNNTKTKNHENLPPPVASSEFNLPDGFESQATDIIGTWNPERNPSVPIGVPMYVNLSDNSAEAEKTSALIFFRLTRECVVYSDDEPIDALPGDIIGIWYKPGMRAIINQAGEETAIIATGEKDIGKRAPMKTFDVRARGKGRRLAVQDDHRKESKHAKNPFITDDNDEPINPDDLPVGRPN